MDTENNKKKLSREQILAVSQDKGYKNAVMLCHTENCCPTMSVNLKAPSDRQVCVTDDFGNQIFMSKEQWRVVSTWGQDTPFNHSA